MRTPLILFAACLTAAAPVYAQVTVDLHALQALPDHPTATRPSRPPSSVAPGKPPVAVNNPACRPEQAPGRHPGTGTGAARTAARDAGKRSPDGRDQPDRAAGTPSRVAAATASAGFREGRDHRRADHRGPASDLRARAVRPEPRKHRFCQATDSIRPARRRDHLQRAGLRSRQGRRSLHRPADLPVPRYGGTQRAGRRWRAFSPDLRSSAGRAIWRRSARPGGHRRERHPPARRARDDTPVELSDPHAGLPRGGRRRRRCCCRRC